MPSTTLQRGNDFQNNLGLTTSLSTSQPIKYAGCSAGMIYLPATHTITQLTWYASADGVNFYPVQDGAGNAQTQSLSASTAMAIPLPLTLFGCIWILAVITGGSLGTGNIQLSLKC
jgi:hypothetical protein